MNGTSPPSPAPDNAKATRLAWLILLIGIVLRAYRLDFQSLWYDEAFSVVAASGPSLADLLTTVGADFHPPLYFLLLHEWLAAFGPSDVAARSLSAAVGAAGLVAMWALARDLLSRAFVPLTLLLSAASLTLIWFSQEVRQYELLFLLGALSLHSFWLLTARSCRVVTAVAYAALTHAALLYTHYASLLVFPAEWAAAVAAAALRVSPREARLHALQPLARLAVAHAASFLLFLPWLPTFLGQLEAARSALWIPAPTVMDLLELPMRLFAYRLPWDTARYPYPLLVLGIPVSWLLVSRATPRGPDTTEPQERKRRAIALVSLSLGPMLLGYLVSLGGAKILFFRNLIFALPAALLGLAAICRSFRACRLLAAVVLAVSVANLPWYFSSRHKEDWRRASAYITNSLAPGTALVFDAYGTRLPFDYYSRGTPVTEFTPELSPRPPHVLYVRSLSHTPLPEITARFRGYGYRAPTRKNFPGIVILSFARE